MTSGGMPKQNVKGGFHNQIPRITKMTMTRNSNDDNNKKSRFNLPVRLLVGVQMRPEPSNHSSVLNCPSSPKQNSFVAFCVAACLKNLGSIC